MSKKFDGLKVDLKTIVLLNAEGKENLISFTETSIKDIDFAAYIEEVQSHVYMQYLSVPYRNGGIFGMTEPSHDVLTIQMITVVSALLLLGNRGKWTLSIRYSGYLKKSLHTPLLKRKVKLQRLKN